MLYEAATSAENFLVCIGKVINVGFVRLVLLSEQIVDGCVVLIATVLVLMTCVAEDIQGGELVLHGGVLIGDWKAKPHFGDDEVIIGPTVGTRDHLCYKHVLLVSPLDEVVNPPVAASNWYPTLTWGSSKLGCSGESTHPLDNPKSDRPERRTALVARELARYNVDIAALSETRFSDQGQLEEVGAGYTFFWSGRPKTGSAIYEANRIATAKAKRAARKSPAPRTNIVDAQALPK
ncbi:unnamed protein product [Schistocephalus solidus]|uniref:Uncharacterized protein n=1 Tax=Schistocephalus solidus TaxID=70667 RepID=A0A183T260_SCHSO|nr:unnamed protein product [Schistocephalus solidus]